MEDFNDESLAKIMDNPNAIIKLPKKGILKNSHTNNQSVASTNSSDLIFMNLSPELSPKSTAQADYKKLVYKK